MKTVILAGGLGTRISEESHLKPKPMIEIGDYPILVHFMRIYATQGFNDFVVCAGYKQQIIKEYFAHFNMYTNDVTFDLSNDTVQIHNEPQFDWKIMVANTGHSTQTGGRIKRAKPYIGNERFMVTYGDAVGNIDVNAVLESHIKSQYSFHKEFYRKTFSFFMRFFSAKSVYLFMRIAYVIKKH